MKLKELQDKWRASSTKCAELNDKLNKGLIDDNVKPEEMQKIKDELDNEKVRRDMLDGQIKDFKPAKEQVEDKAIPVVKDKAKLAKDEINKFVHNQVTSTEMASTIPEEIIYDPSAEVNSVVDLSTLVNKTPVTTKKGTYPILKRADDSFPSVEELKTNPELAAPNFTDVEWSVDTYRGALTISQESIDDSAADVSGIVTQNLGEKRVNTYNGVIAPILKGFTAKSATADTLTDDIKHVLNVDLDPAYSPVIIASQSFYNTLDTLKDKNGQYVFHQDITSASQGTLLGIPVYKVGDSLLGKSGESHAFIGDIKRAVFFADRKEVSLAWQYNEAYGNYLAGVLRFGVTTADAKAGYFMTISTTDAGTGTGE